MPLPSHPYALLMPSRVPGSFHHSQIPLPRRDSKRDACRAPERKDSQGAIGPSRLADRCWRSGSKKVPPRCPVLPRPTSLTPELRTPVQPGEKSRAQLALLLRSRSCPYSFYSPKHPPSTALQLCHNLNPSFPFMRHTFLLL